MKTAPLKPKLCRTCWPKHEAWLDYRPPAPLRIHVIGNDSANVRHGARVLDTIRRQQAMVRLICAQHCQADVPFDDEELAKLRAAAYGLPYLRPALKGPVTA